MYVLKYRRGRRFGLVKSVELDCPAPCVGWCAAPADALQFATRKDAAAQCAALKIAGFSRGGTLTVVPADDPHNVKRWKGPRLRINDPDLAARVQGTARTLLGRARRAGHNVPDDAEVRCWVLSNRSRASWGGQWRDSGYGIAIVERVATCPTPGYFVHIVAHELAHVCHAFETGKTDHGPEFIRWLRILCPPEWIEWALVGTGADEARAAGIAITPDTHPAIAAYIGQRVPSLEDYRWKT